MEKHKHILLYFFSSFVFVMLFSRSTSFLYVFEGFDAAIFKQMGLAVLHGKTLYIDYFDNKGCILYFIQALGLYLGGNFALLLMQAISLTVTLVWWDRIIAFYQEGRRRYFYLGVALFLLLCFYEGGNLSEEWCLPFASYPVYLYFRRLKTKEEIHKLEMFAVGLCFGIIAFIRINNASVFLGFFLYLFFIFLQKKEFKRFFTDALLILLGTLLIAVACITYFYLKAGRQGIEEMIYGSFLSYFEYFGFQFKKSVYFYAFYVLFLVVCIALSCINTVNQKDIFIPILVSYFFFILSTGTRCFTHYLMATMPLFVVGLATIDFDKHRKINLILSLVAIIPLLSYLIRPVGFFVNDVIMNEEPFKTSYGEFHRCIEEIPETERESIYNYNLSGIGAGMMQHEGLLQCNRVLYSPLAFHLPRLHREEVSKPFVPPLWILISGDMSFEAEDAMFIQENYELKNYFEHNTQYIKGLEVGNLITVCFYRRKY